jgi:hypothetical protein
MLKDKRCFVLNRSVRNPIGRLMRSLTKLGTVATRETSRSVNWNSCIKIGMSAT